MKVKYFLDRLLVLVEGFVASDLGLEFDELFGHLVRRPLGENAEDRPSRLVHLDATTQRKPARTGTLRDKFKLCS